MKAEYLGDKGCLQRDSAEREEYAGAQSVDNREAEEADGAELLERILSRNNLNSAFKRVKANKGAPGIDGMTVEDAPDWLREHRDELLESIRSGKYKPQPVRRKEIPKPDGGVRQLGIPTVVDRIIQQAIAQQLTPIYEPLFSENSFGYRPGKSAQMAIQKVKEYAEQGYKYAVLIDLSKYFDTLNHELLMNMVREQVQDKRVTELIKKYLKSGVMEDGLLVKTEEGSPQGGPLSPLLANIYLNKYDQEMGGRGVPAIRYADDIVVLAKSERAAERLLENSRKYLEEKLKLRMNAEKSKVVKVAAIRNFKFLGFALGRGKNGYYIRAHVKSLKKAKQKLKELTSRSQGRNVRTVMENVKVFIRGWLGYFGIASMKSTMEAWDGWLRRRFRMYIWKQWKTPKTRIKNLKKLGMPGWQAYRNGNTRKGYWAVAGSGILTHTITNKRLAQAGYYSILDRYESLHSCD
ncbi:MAG: group II intron reverse transcriptase/maturase [Clostridiales bacterium]|nr:group II intron reverse transcriptase/maturase [Clostridiales bacterium]